MNNKLFVGNLSFNTTENDLQDAFAAHGTVLEANLMMDRTTGRPRGFGFVTMSTQEEAEKAIAALNREITTIGELAAAQKKLLERLPLRPDGKQAVTMVCRISPPRLGEALSRSAR